MSYRSPIKTQKKNMDGNRNFDNSTNQRNEHDLTRLFDSHKLGDRSMWLHTVCTQLNTFMKIIIVFLVFLYILLLLYNEISFSSCTFFFSFRGLAATSTHTAHTRWIDELLPVRESEFVNIPIRWYSDGLPFFTFFFVFAVGCFGVCFSSASVYTARSTLEPHETKINTK